MTQMELFDEAKQADSFFQTERDYFVSFDTDSDLSALFELSVDAFHAVLYARMSELPIKGQISRFAERVIRSKDRAKAAQAASDRGDPDALTVLKAAYKVQLEIHRVMGFLRFTAGDDGVYSGVDDEAHQAGSG